MRRFSKVGPTIAWYQDSCATTSLPWRANVEGRCPAVVCGALVLLPPLRSLLALPRRGRVAAASVLATDRHYVGLVAASRLTPTKWAVQFGASRRAGRGVGCGHRTTFALRIGLHSRRTSRHVTALLPVLAWATCINGRFTSANYGAPWWRHPACHRQPPGDVDVSDAVDPHRTLAACASLPMEFTPGNTEVKDNRRNRILASTPLLVVAVIMVAGEVG